MLGLAFELIEQLRDPVVAIARQDAFLADQIRRAASSVALNIGEAAHNYGGNRKNRLLSAAGSANETRAGLNVAAAWQYVKTDDVRVSLELIDRIVAMLWKWRSSMRRDRDGGRG